MSELARLDANLLVAFDAILAERKLNRAGERLGMSQAAMSGALARLRKLLDDPLVVRSGKSVSLTPKAEEMRPLVRDALAEIHRTLGALARFDPATSRRVFSIVASDYALSVLTSPLLTAISAEAPWVSVTFEALPENPSSTGTDLLRHDLVVAASGRVPGRRRTLFTDEFVCLVSADNPRLRGGALTAEDLRQMGHVAVTFGDATSTPADQALADAGIMPRRAISTRGFLIAPFLVSGTDLVTMVPGRLAATVPPALGLVVARTPLPRAELVEAAHWNPGSVSDPALRWLLGVLRRISACLDGAVDAAPGRSPPSPARRLVDACS
jgi:DNA-binding transcriptional LysR family regulator